MPISGRGSSPGSKQTHEGGSGSAPVGTATEDAHGGSWASKRPDTMKRSNARLG